MRGPASRPGGGNLARAALAWAAVVSGCNAPVTVLDLTVNVDAALSRHNPGGTFAVTPRDTQDIKLTLAPATCTDGICRHTMEVPTGDYDVTFTLQLDDRCGARSDVATFRAVAPASLWGAPPLFERIEDDLRAHDDDGDGIGNLAELALCGRFDVAESDLPVTACAAADDPCCAEHAGDEDLQGQQALFTPVPFAGTSLDPFLLDATEVTWATLTRCVVAGCVALEALPAAVQEPVLDLANGIKPWLRDRPAQGLTPEQALDVCAWLGKRLPTDDEWYYAAAHRAGSDEPARYPFDWSEGQQIGCRADDPSQASGDADGTDTDPMLPVNANHAAANESCIGAPDAVGSYASSHGDRGDGSRVADLAGNVAEWTVVRADTAQGPITYEQITEVVLRGGDAAGSTALMQNDIAFRASTSSLEEIAALAVRAGFRCAADGSGVTSPPARRTEPACGGTP